MKKLIIALLVLIGGTGGAYQLGGWQSSSQSSFGDDTYIDYSSTTISAAASSTTILVANADRQWAKLCADNASSTVFVQYGTTTDMGLNGFVLVKGNTTNLKPQDLCYEINFTNLYVGRVAVYSTSSGMIIWATENNK